MSSRQSLDKWSFMSISKKLLFPFLLLCFFLIFTGRAAAANCGGRVNASCISLKAEADASSETLSLVYEDERVIITGRHDKWYSVIYNGTAGYMFAEYVTQLNKTDISPASAYINANSVRFHSAADYSAGVIYYLSTGAPLKVCGITGEWYRVTYGETVGYVHSDYVDIYYDESDYYTPGKKIVEYAKQFLGTRYIYGSSSPSGFDCSGFTSYVLQQNGYDSTRTCTSQYAQYTKIERNELRIGDLVFFASTQSWDTNHVGIYMGNNLFIHASSGKGCVTVSSLKDEYYDAYYYGAARYLPA